MNQMFKYILVGGASALAGGIAGYFFHKKKVEDEINKRVSEAVNEELERIRNNKDNHHKPFTPEEVSYYLKTDDDLYYEARVAIEQEFGDLDGFDEDRVNPLMQCLVHCQKMGFTEDQTDSAIKKLLAETESPEEDDDVEEVGADDPQLTMESYQNEPPTIINVDEYSALPPYFEFVTYQYYEEDDILMDDQNCIIDDVNRIVGDALVHFGECNPMDDTVYVVNGQMGLAIEIERIHSSYYECHK